MALTIISVKNQGKASQEYVIFKATADVNINQYMVEDTTYKPSGKVSNVHRHPFRFPSKIVKKGEYVLLYTTKGTPDEGKMTSGEKNHRFYWNSDAAIWNDQGDEVVLLKVSTAGTLKVA